MATIRQNQIARLIQRELGFYFQKEVNNPVGKVEKGSAEILLCKAIGFFSF